MTSDSKSELEKAVKKEEDLREEFVELNGVCEELMEQLEAMAEKQEGKVE